MTELSREELRRFGEYLDKKLTDIEDGIPQPDFNEQSHAEFAERATLNAYKVAALNEVRLEFMIELNSAKDE